jgi:hypothetical protein
MESASRRKARTAATRRSISFSSESPSYEKIALTCFSTVDSDMKRFGR